MYLSMQCWDASFICTLSSRRQVTQHTIIGFLDLHSDVSVTFYVSYDHYAFHLVLITRLKYGPFSHGLVLMHIVFTFYLVAKPAL